MAGRPPRRVRGLGHHLHPDRRRHDRGGRLPARRRLRRGGVLGQDRPDRTCRSRTSSLGQRSQGPRRHLGARHGLRQRRSRLRDPPRCTLLAHLLLPAGGPGRPGHRPRRRRLVARRRRRCHLGLLRLARLPAPVGHRHHPRHAGDRRRPHVDPGPRGQRGPHPLASRGHPQGSRCRGCGTPGPRRLGGHRLALALRHRTLRPRGGHPARRARCHVGLRHHRPLPHALLARPARRSVHEAGLRPLRQLRRPGPGILGVHRPPSSGPAAPWRRPGATIEPHKLWPSNLAKLGVPLSGRISADEAAEPGRALARFTDLGWGSAVRAAVDASAPDADVPEQLVRGAIEVLVEWKEDWAERPAAIASISGRTHPRLVHTLADALGSVGRLPHIGAVVHDGPPRPRRPYQLGATPGPALGHTRPRAGPRRRPAR